MKQGWEYKRLGNVCDLRRGLTYSKDDEAAISSNLVLRSNNIDLDSMKLDLTEIKYLKDSFTTPSEKKLKGGSVFLCMSNGSKHHVGKVAYIEKDMDFAFGGFMGLIVPLDRLFPKFVYYVCRSSLWRGFMDSIGKGIGITNLRFSELADFSIPVPSIDEQKAICSLLDKMNRVIEAKKEQLKELDNLAQAIFYDMFGDPITNQKGWKIKKIEDIAILNKGITYKPENVVKEGGTIVLRSGNIKGNVFDLEDVVRVDSNINPSKYVHENEILMCNRNGSAKLVGKVAKIPKIKEKMSFGTFMTIVRSDMYEYLFAFFQTDAFREQIRFSTAIAINQISLPLLASVKVPVPPIELQQSFADKIEAIERQKELINQSIKDVQTLFDAKMDYYFGD